MELPEPVDAIRFRMEQAGLSARGWLKHLAVQRAAVERPAMAAARVLMPDRTREDFRAATSRS